MRLLNVHSLEFAEFSDDGRPRYVAASHRWLHNHEVTFQDIQNGRNKESKGYEKVEAFAKYIRTNTNAVEWLWIDTCCINKDSSAELSEAINSMFEWYRHAEICLVYLADVGTSADVRSFEKSEWFKRGWTLQELVAPQIVVFVTERWQVIGHKGDPLYGACLPSIGIDLNKTVARITHLPEQVLRDYNASLDLSIDEKIEWMNGRSTTRPEDMSYALFGILGVTLPVIYGEKYEGARQRLLDVIHQRDYLAAHQAENYKKITDWLSPFDPRKHHNDVRDLHEPQTGDWLIQSSQYHEWKAASTRHLWIHGKVGCGKTVLCSTAIEDVKTYCNHHRNAGHAVFYFSFSDESRQDQVNLLCSLIVQLGWKGPALSMLQHAYNKQSRGFPGVDELEEILLSCFQSYEDVFLLIDALDECPEERDVRQKMLECLIRLSQKAHHLRIFTTSRELSDIRESMMVLGAQSVPITTHSVNDDICKYVVKQLTCHTRLSRLDPTTKTLIRNTISGKADGMFRWAFCQLQELKKLKSTKPKYIRTVVDSLPSTLDETYRRMLNLIEPELRAEALSLLRWLAYAKSPRSLAELVDVTVIDVAADTTVDVENRGGMDDVLEILSGLVIIDGIPEYKKQAHDLASAELKALEPENQTINLESHRQTILPETKVRLAHFSVKEYLESERILQSDAREFHLEIAVSHRVLAQSCLRYITHYSRSAEKLSTEEDLTTFPLLLYAARSWFFHSTLQQTMDDAHEESLFCHQDVLLDWLQIYQPDRAWQRPFQNLKDVGPGLYYASAVGLEAVVGTLLEHGADVNQQGGRYGNALQVASFLGHAKVVQKLIDAGAYVNIQNGHHTNALLAASIEGHPKIVSLLLDNGAQLVTDHNNMTALQYSVLGGHEEVAHVILNKGIPVDLPMKRRIWRPASQDGDQLWTAQDDPCIPLSVQALEHGLTALHYAVLIGSVVMTKLLVDRGANPNALSEYGETPLHLAVKRGLYGPDLAKGIVDHWNDPLYRAEYIFELIDIENDEEYAIAQANVEAIDNSVLDILFAQEGMDPSIQDCFGMTPLHCVPYGRRISVITFNRLLQSRIPIDQRDISGRTALHLACAAANMNAVQMLIRNGANIQYADNSGLNALHYAACGGESQVISFILTWASESGLENFAKIKDHRGQNALHCLVGRRDYVDLAAVQCLTACGININDLTDDRECALSRYLTSVWLDRSRHRAEIVDHMFRVGADASFKSPKGGGTLSHLAASADEVGVELLTVLADHGVDLHTKDDQGRTILHHCALGGSIEEENALDFLCDTIGLSIDSCDNLGMTPLSLVKQQNALVHHPNQFRPDRWTNMERLLKTQT